MLPFWKESPFVRILLPFLAGIVFYLCCPADHITIIGGCACLCLSAIVYLQYRHDFFKLKYAFTGGILIQIFLILLAYLICILHTASTSKYWYKHQAHQYPFALVKITSPPEKKEKTTKVEVEIVQLYNSVSCINTIGSAFVYFQHDEKNTAIHQGDYVLIKNKLKDIIKSGNPGSFDYAKYCASKNIFQSAYLTSNEWQKTKKHSEDFDSYCAYVNAQTCAVLKKYIPDSNAHGVAEALLLGYRTDIDDNTWQAYTDTGIVHIIAISGMHMAMVYGSARFLLLLLPFLKKRKYIAILIALFLMWVFASITGLPASVTRAAVMFTFIGFGEMHEKKPNSINTLAASAFCMLCYNPMMILDVGFQLSYLAVLSLIFFYSPIYHLLYVSNKIADAVWKLIAMTLAAQVLTLPLCIYYFHQFPLLFVVTNLFAVPLTTVILYIEILLVLLQSLTPVAQFLGLIVSFLVSFVNHTVFTFSHFSFAVWTEINISALQMLLLFVIIGFIALYLFYKNVRHLILTLLTLFVFCVTLLSHQFLVFRQQKIIVYNIPNQSCIEFIAQHHYFNPERDSLQKKEKNEIYTLKPAHIFYSVSKSGDVLAGKEKNAVAELFSFKGQKILRLENTNFQTDTLLRVDILILSHQCNIDSIWLAQHIIAKQIVLDSSVPFWKTEQLKKVLGHLSIPVHVVTEEGAFVFDI